jgi:hypothetical protein
MIKNFTYILGFTYFLNHYIINERVCMKQNSENAEDAAWISRFWALYRLLSEPQKEGFISMAQSIAQDVERQKCRQKDEESSA